MLSTNQLGQPYCPDETHPRALTMPLGAAGKAGELQPPEIRVPDPSSTQSVPFEEDWKLVRHNSGAVPPRNHVTVVPVLLMDSVAGFVFVRRATYSEGGPPASGTSVPSRILPSVCSATA